MELDNSPVKANEGFQKIVSKAVYLNKLGKSKSKELEAIFSPMMEKLDEFEERFNQVISESENGIDNELTEKAKRLRLDIRQIRTGAESERKREKAEYLVAGKAIDEASKAVQNAVEEKENILLDIEKHFENLEKIRIQNLQDERVQLLSTFVEDAEQMDLGNMGQDVFDAFFKAKEKAFNDAIEAEKKAEADRVAKEKEEAEERELQRLENERLKAEAIEREKEIEKEKAEYDRLAKIESDKQAKIQAELKAKAKAERIEREKIQEELKAKQEEEAKAMAEKAKAERIAKEEAESKAKQPIKAQLNDWVNSFELPSTNIENEATKAIREKFESFKKWAEREVNNI